MSRLLTHAGLARRGVTFHWPVSLAIALGVAIATAVITGALVVGDSMRASLRGLTIDRLGRIEQVVLPGRFFSAESLPQAIAGREIHPVILFERAAVEAGSEAEVRRAGSVQVIGIEPRFWTLDPSWTAGTIELDDDEIILNRAAAEELEVQLGELVTVRLPAEQAVPADSPLGRRDAQSEGIPRLRVVRIIDNRGLGRFALQPNQAEPMTALLSRETIAETLQRDGQANALLVTAAATPASAAASGPAAEPATANPRAAGDAWIDALDLDLADFGLQLDHVRQLFEPQGQTPQVIFDYFSVSSEQLLLPPAAAQAIQAAGAHGRSVPMLTYLANAIERIDPASGEVTASVPYSTITAIDSHPQLPLDYAVAGPAPLAATGPEAGPEAGPATGTEPAPPAPMVSPVPMVLNQWTADALAAQQGDTLRIVFFEPEVQGGKEVERAFTAVVSGIVPITRPAQPYRRTRPAVFAEPPTLYNDPDLTPTVPGVTDQDSISDWDLPFPLEREISSEDDRYWNEHRLTPKAFLPLAAGQRLFGSRFGDTTSIRIDAAAVTSQEQLESDLLAALRKVRSQLGWAAIPIRQQQLEASRGTTPFDALFLSLSLFVILAALMLIVLLFRLGLLQRAREYGVLLAVGFPGATASRLAIREGMWIAIPGILLGIAGGLLYAAAVLAGLRSWWVGAVTVPFLEFHASAASLIIGGVAGAAVSLLTLFLTARKLRQTTARQLLAGQVAERGDAERSRGQGRPTTGAHTTSNRRAPGERRLGWAASVLVLLACVLAVVGFGGSGPAQAGAFVGGGMLLLIASLLLTHRRLSLPSAGGRGTGRGAARRQSLRGLAWTNVGRHPLRSTLSIGLMAVASFLIVSISAFQLTPTQSGVGGFDLIGRTATPFYRDLGDPQVRREVLGQDAAALEDSQIVSLRLQPGQDASCNNLYQATQPQVLGIPPGMSQATKEHPFQWAAAVSPPRDSEPGAWSPWEALQHSAAGTAEDPVPVILDQNTAMWSLQMRGGVGEVRSFAWQEGRWIHFRVVGLLANSMLQGSLMIGEGNFQQHFAHISGYSQCLIRTADPDRAHRILEHRLGDLGMDVTATHTVLARLMAVQNTYLRTFQSLGALGLLLGTIGLAIAQLRNALERQGELAVMRAIGFARRRLAAAVMLETSLVLGLGIGCGVLCAALAVTPYLLTGQSRPPIAEPLLAVLLIAGFGLVAGSLAVARVVRMPLVGALRK